MSPDSIFRLKEIVCRNVVPPMFYKGGYSLGPHARNAARVLRSEANIETHLDEDTREVVFSDADHDQG